MRQGEDVEGGHAVGDGTDFSLFGIDTAMAHRRRECAGAARVVELELCHRGRDFIVGQHQAEHGDSTGEREVVGLHFCGYNQIAIIIEGIGHFVVGERHLFCRGNRGRTITIVGDDHKLIRPGGKSQGNGAIASIALLLCHGLNLRAVGIEDGYVQATAQLRDVGGGTGSCTVSTIAKRLLLILRHVQDDVGPLH